MFCHFKFTVGKCSQKMVDVMFNNNKAVVRYNVIK